MQQIAGGRKTDKQEKIGRIVEEVNIYASCSDRPTITKENLRKAIVDASRGWGDVLTSASSKREYATLLVDLGILTPANETSYYFNAQVWQRQDRPAVLPVTHKRLSMKQALAVDMIIGGASDAEIAQQLDLSRSTVWRWRTAVPAFKTEIEAAKTKAPEQEVRQ